MIAEKGAGRSGLLIGDLIGGFFAFILMGLWHGTQYMFFWLGIFLALGITVNRIWDWLNIKDEFGAYTWLVDDLHGAWAWLYFGIAAISVWPTTTNLDSFADSAARIATLEGFLGAVSTMFGLILARRITIFIDELPPPPVGVYWVAKQILLAAVWAGVVILFGNALSEISTFNYYADIT